MNTHNVKKRIKMILRLHFGQCVPPVLLSAQTAYLHAMTFCNVAGGGSVPSSSCPHVKVSFGKTVHPKLLQMVKPDKLQLWIKALHKWIICHFVHAGDEEGQFKFGLFFPTMTDLYRHSAQILHETW